MINCLIGSSDCLDIVLSLLPPPPVVEADLPLLLRVRHLKPQHQRSLLQLWTEGAAGVKVIVHRHTLALPLPGQHLQLAPENSNAN